MSINKNIKYLKVKQHGYNISSVNGINKMNI